MKLGALPPKTDLRDYKYEEPAGVVEYPKEFSLWTPKVKDQGQINSCVAHTSAEIEEYFVHKETGEYTPLSVGYIYGCRYDYKGQGMYLRDALKTLQKRGIAQNREFDYNEEVPKMIEIFQNQEAIGFVTDRFNKITTYFQINKTDRNAIKSALMNCGPVMISIAWRPDFIIKDGILISSLRESRGNHCMMLYGWNEKGWLIQNSWGEEWGTEGRIIYPYSYPFEEVWGITDEENLNQVSKPNKRKIKIIDWLYKLVNLCLRVFEK